jgi:hypothetical protein
MMSKNILYLLFGIILLFGCKDDPAPSLFDPNAYQAAFNDVPEISSIAPAESSYAGVGNLIITGKNFNPNEPVAVNNRVEFIHAGDFAVGDILSTSSNEITVKSPVLVGDSIQVRVWSSGADPYSEKYYYRLKAAVAVLSVVDPKQVEANYHSVAVSADGKILIAVENLGTATTKGAIKVVDPDGNVEATHGISAQIVEGVKYGPGNKAYFTFAVGRAKQIRTVDLASGAEATFSNVSVVPKDLDFDPDQNVWVVGRQAATTLYPSDVISINADGSGAQVAATFDVFLQTVRIFSEGGNNYVYVAGYNTDTGEEKIWRNMIKADGTLEAPEVVLDVAAATWLEGNVQSVTFSAAGTMYIGTTSAPDAIFKYDPASDSHEVLYPGLLAANFPYISWDNGIFMYAVQQLVGGTTKILKIDLGETGAPYYGRQ